MLETIKYISALFFGIPVALACLWALFCWLKERKPTHKSKIISLDSLLLDQVISEKDYKGYENDEEGSFYLFGTGYKQYLESEEWQEIKDIVLERDNYTCQDCGVNLMLEIHHLSYKYLYREKENNYRDLITLCSDCHDDRHEIMDVSVSL